MISATCATPLPVRLGVGLVAALLGADGQDLVQVRQRLQTIGRPELGPPDVDVVIVALLLAAGLGRGAEDALMHLHGVGCVGRVPDGDEVTSGHRGTSPKSLGGTPAEVPRAQKGSVGGILRLEATAQLAEELLERESTELDALVEGRAERHNLCGVRLRLRA